MGSRRGGGGVDVWGGYLVEGSVIVNGGAGHEEEELFFSLLIEEAIYFKHEGLSLGVGGFEFGFFDVVDDEFADLFLLIIGWLDGCGDGIEEALVFLESVFVGETDVVFEEFVVELVFDFFVGW